VAISRPESVDEMGDRCIEQDNLRAGLTPVAVAALGDGSGAGEQDDGNT